MGKKVDIDAVIADIESAIAENGVSADVAEWIAEAESLAKTVTIAELDRNAVMCMVVFRLLWMTNICRIVSVVLKKEGIIRCGCSLKKWVGPIKSLCSVQVVKRKQLRTFLSVSAGKNVSWRR